MLSYDNECMCFDVYIQPLLAHGAEHKFALKPTRFGALPTWLAGVTSRLHSFAAAKAIEDIIGILVEATGSCLSRSELFLKVGFCAGPGAVFLSRAVA